MKSFWRKGRINHAKRTIRKALKGLKDLSQGDIEFARSNARFGEVLEKRPVRLVEILECLESSRSFERKLGSVMFRAWIVDPADVELQRLSLASVIRSESRRLEGRGKKSERDLSPYESMIIQAAARLSPRHAAFYACYYLEFGEASVERAPTLKLLSEEFFSRSRWLPEALTMLAGLHRMHDVSMASDEKWSPSLLKGYKFAKKNNVLRPGLAIFGEVLEAREEARGKKTIEDNLKNKSLAPCVWYCAWNATAADGRSMVDVIGDVRIDLSAYLSDLDTLLRRATYVWETIALPEC